MANYSHIHVEVVSQERPLFNEPEADMVVVPGSEGVMGILPNHSPLITTMNYGELIVRKGEAEETFIIYGGVVEVRPDKVVVLADAADFAAEISLREAEEARARVLQILEDGVPPEDEAFIAAELKRAELAVNIARKTESRAGSVGIRIVKERKKDEE
jgi:F-type H+-transporting ATPase subunit epsilon